MADIEHHAGGTLAEAREFYCSCGVLECDGVECLTPEGDARCRALAAEDDREAAFADADRRAK